MSCTFVSSVPSDSEPFHHDSVDHEHNPLIIDGAKEPSLKDLEGNYDMLHDIEQEKDIYRLRVIVNDSVVSSPIIRLFCF